MQKIIVANWKMTLKKTQIEPLVQIINQVEKKDLTIVVCPSFVHLPEVAEKNDGSFFLGAQDCFWEEHGAYTGEVSAWDLKDGGCYYVLIGHSERRRYFGETDEDVNKKVKASLAAGVVPILCVGETKEEKEAGITLEVIKNQLRKDLAEIAPRSNLIVAYEPVWAIGTGDFCSPQIAAEVQFFIKEEVEVNIGLGKTPVLYGGSVDDANVVDFLRQNYIDGVLVGGASTKPDVLAKLLANSIF